MSHSRSKDDSKCDELRIIFCNNFSKICNLKIKAADLNKFLFIEIFIARFLPYSYFWGGSDVSLRTLLMTLMLLLIQGFSIRGLAENSHSTSSKQNEKEATFDLIWKALEDFNSPDLNVSLAAVHTLSAIRYYDVSDLLAELTLQELVGTRKNRMMATELFDQLIARSDRRQMFDELGVARQDSKLLAINIELSKPVYRQNREMQKRRIFQGLIHKAINAARTRELKYPRLSEAPLTLKLVQERHRQKSVNQHQANPSLSQKPVQKQVALDYKNILEQLTGLNTKSRTAAKKQVKAGDAGPIDILMAGTTRYLSDEIADDIRNIQLFNIIGRNDILREALLILSRFKQQNVVLLGSRGSGKTSIVELVAEAIVTGMVTENQMTRFLKNAVILETTVGRISRLAKSDKAAGQADAMEAYFQALSEVQKISQRRIIVYIDELHRLTPDQVEAIKPFIESSKSQIMLIGASTSPEFRSAFKYNEAFLSRLQDLPVREMSESEILYIFKESWMKALKTKHPNLKIDESIMKLIIRKSQLVYPDKGILRATFHFADDVAGSLRYEAVESSSTEITSKDVYNFIQRKIGLPVDPTDFVAMKKYKNKLIKDISDNVFGQERMVHDIVELWMSVLRNEAPRGIKVGMVMGRSGTGKTETATQLALRAFQTADGDLGSKERVFVIKATEYADADDIKLGVLFGVPGGVRFGEHTGGLLMDWLDDPSKGKYAGVILIDEAEKASPLFWVRLMELFDTGSIMGGDNKTRTLNRHLILLTSNRGDHEIFPPESAQWTDEQRTDRVKSYSEEDLKDLFVRSLFQDDKGHLPDTILNRIDQYSLTNLITPKLAGIIGRAMLKRLRDEFVDRSGVDVTVSEETIEDFIRVYNPLKWGARPFVRALDKYIRSAINDPLGDENLEYQRGDKMHISIQRNPQGEAVLNSHINGKDLHTHLPRFSGEYTISRTCKSLFVR